ncbi:hypothetical protein Ocin01_11792 [Orchesella cincta]|uniref:Uncharacterized protein n=1 Tax=Orchesella cincta TaxID=48709 RepID=A0A1D2MPV2_ORCCI|nr:hypothetical protein Ocin01_11792 [Orchesella cincta]
MKIQFFSRRNMMLDHCQNLLHFWEPLVCSVLFISGGVLYEGGDKWIRKDKMGILFSAWIQIAVLACLVKLAMVKLFACLTDFCKTEVEQPSLPPPNAPPPANPPPNVPKPQPVQIQPYVPLLWTRSPA